MLILTGGAFGERATAFLEDVDLPRLYKPFTPQISRKTVEDLVDLSPHRGELDPPNPNR